jgi:hypothetical protein
VCWSLVGYISGYASACFEREIYFRESSCLGEGKGSCTVVGRDADSWGNELEPLRQDFQGTDLGGEVERLQSAVRGRLQEVARRERALDKRERELNVLRERIARHTASKHFIARSQSMQEVLELAARVAPSTRRSWSTAKRHWQGIHRPDDSRAESPRVGAVRVESTAQR